MLCMLRSSLAIFGFSKVLRSPKGWHQRETEKYKDAKIPKILQERESRAFLELSVFKSSKYNIY